MESNLKASQRAVRHLSTSENNGCTCSKRRKRYEIFFECFTNTSLVLYLTAKTLRIFRLL